jgi:hypothetical protein
MVPSAMTAVTTNSALLLAAAGRDNEDIHHADRKGHAMVRGEGKGEEESKQVDQAPQRDPVGQILEQRGGVQG